MQWQRRKTKTKTKTKTKKKTLTVTVTDAKNESKDESFIGFGSAFVYCWTGQKERNFETF